MNIRRDMIVFVPRAIIEGLDYFFKREERFYSQYAQKKAPGADLLLTFFTVLSLPSISYIYVTTEYIWTIFGGNIHGYLLCNNRHVSIRKILVRGSYIIIFEILFEVREQ